jgi:hypothetical protein
MLSVEFQYDTLFECIFKEFLFAFWFHMHFGVFWIKNLHNVVSFWEKVPSVYKYLVIYWTHTHTVRARAVVEALNLLAITSWMHRNKVLLLNFWAGPPQIQSKSVMPKVKCKINVFLNKMLYRAFCDHSHRVLWTCVSVQSLWLCSIPLAEEYKFLLFVGISLLKWTLFMRSVMLPWRCGLQACITQL